MSRKLLIILLVLGTVLLSACAGGGENESLTLTHPSPEELGQQPRICTECHDADDSTFVWKHFNHDANFGRNHRMQANQQQQLCSFCHQESFCSDCHANRIELKPSLRLQSETYRQMPHRGDYLSRHQIDGRLNPVSCVRCHGNQQKAKTCARCHG